ncbi:hypothetical protein ACHAXS_009100 [Conticribra weissflogii]
MRCLPITSTKHPIVSVSSTMMKIFSIPLVILLISRRTNPTAAFAYGKGFGRGNSQNNPSFVTFDRFKSSCPADADAIRQFDPTLISDENNDDTWVAVFRSSNNLPSVFVKDAFFDAMAQSTTNQDGDAETLVSSRSSVGSGVINTQTAGAQSKPVAVARLSPSSSAPNVFIIDSMRCTLKKENTDPDCDGGSEHTEAIGVCIDELVLSYLQKNIGDISNNEKVKFDGGVRFRGTLVSGKLLEARGFKEVNALSSDMHSHESDFDGALKKYAERSTSKEIAKNPGARDRALKIVSYLAKIDREGELQSKTGTDCDDGGDDDSDFDPWSSVKRYL